MGVKGLYFADLYSLVNLLLFRFIFQTYYSLLIFYTCIFVNYSTYLYCLSFFSRFSIFTRWHFLHCSFQLIILSHPFRLLYISYDGWMIPYVVVTTKPLKQLLLHVAIVARITILPALLSNKCVTRLINL